MRKKRITIIGIAVFLFVFLFAKPGLLFSFGEKAKVISQKTNIYMKPSLDSLIIETLDKGTVLRINSSGIFRKNFLYVYFTSIPSGKVKSGYVHDSQVQKMDNEKKSIDIGKISGKHRKNWKLSRSKKAAWGMSKKEILEIMGSPVQKEVLNGLEILGYKQTIMNFNCLVGYIFSNKKLSGTKYIFLQRYNSDNKYINEFGNIKNQISKNCGLPNRDDIIWRNALYKNDYSNWGYAIRMGHLDYCARWKTSDTEILLTLFGAEREINLEVEYTFLN